MTGLPRLRRWDVVLAALPGDYGKPRPVLVVQSDALNDTHESVVVCPFTSDPTGEGMLRVAIRPDAGNGLRAASYVMADKIAAARRDRLRGVVGRIGVADRARVEAALALVLGFAQRPSRKPA